MSRRNALSRLLIKNPTLTNVVVSYMGPNSDGDLVFHVDREREGRIVCAYSLNDGEEDEDSLTVAASLLARRSVEVEKTKDGKYIVLYMRFEKSPPPKEDTPIEALRSFIRMMLQRNQEVGTMIADGHKKGENNANRTGHSSGPDQEDQSS